jgi:transcriptional regulator with XRE-family HTH domain
MNLGKAIRLCRIQRNLNQSELAESADISVSYLSLLERGKRDPNFSTVERIAAALNVPVSILVFLAADEEELSGISPELREKLSYTALRLIEHSNGKASLHKEPDRVR